MWHKVKIQGISCMVFEGWTGKYPRGYKHRYHMRHVDNDMSIPATVEIAVVVNHWGQLISKKPIKMKNIGIDGHKCMVYDITKKEKNEFERVLSGG